jgi:hypothetical protein
MATKLKLMKFLQEIRGYAEITNRRPMPRPAALYLMQLRAQAVEVAMPRRKLPITVDLKKNPDLPHPVKITHVQPGTAALPVVIG